MSPTKGRKKAAEGAAGDLNEAIARRFDDVAQRLEDEGANRWRVRAYRRAAEGLRSLSDSVRTILEERGIPGLVEVPGIGPGLARAARDLVEEHVGPLDVPQTPVRPPDAEPTVEELLDVDREYRERVEAKTLRLIAPRRMNPRRESWLPVLHTTRAGRHYTALFSNTPRAHAVGKTHDWVVLYYDGPEGERKATVITSERGALAGKRIVRGREPECRAHHEGRRAPGQERPATGQRKRAAKPPSRRRGGV